MDKLKLVKQWLHDNGYEEQIQFISPIKWHTFTKTYNDNDTWAYQEISFNEKTYEIESRIQHRSITKTANDLECLFIPLNRVKRDEKNLREFLNEPKEIIIYEDDDGEDENGNSIIRKWGICPHCGKRIDLKTTKCPHCDKELINGN